MSIWSRVRGASVVRARRRAAVALTVAATVAGSLLAITGAAAPAVADTAPVAPETTSTVSADALPTTQINGVVYSQVIVGTTVYATGEFTSARPAGSPLGTNETPRSNILAYDLTTGQLLPWAPALNAKGMAITASADGKMIFVGGSFTSVSGVTRNRIVALDATSGAVISTWNPNASSRVDSLAVQGDTLYFGGIFTTVGGQSRNEMASVVASTGALTSWAPTANADVMAMTAPAGSGNVVIGGRFTTVNGASVYGLGAVDATTGANKAFAINSVVKNAGTAAAIYSLTNDGTNVYGTGYTYGSGGNFENTFAANASSGAEVWVSGCLGDTYSSTVTNGVLYYVSHTHNCTFIGGKPDGSPRDYQHASAETITPYGTNNGGNFSGQPAPQLLSWTPDLAGGTYTGLSQAAWSAASNSKYLVLGGEFPTVNGTAQQGLVRFAVSSIAPNKVGPDGLSASLPTITAAGDAAVRLKWTAAFDRDNRWLKWEVLRGATVGTSTVVGSGTVNSIWWGRPTQSFVDGTAPGGSSQTYRIRFTDAFGNTGTTNSVTTTIPSGTASTGTYASQVASDGAADYWRLGETSGTTGYDWGSTPNDLTLTLGATRGVTGAIKTDTNAATTFPGNATAPAYATTSQTAPATFTEEAWFQTTSSSGGKIIGFGNSRTGSSSTYDRMVYLTNSGQVVFGMSAGGQQVITSTGTYRDGTWHHVAASYSGGTMSLYVDGTLIGTKTGLTSLSSYTGYWRVGGDNLGNVFGGWPSRPSSAALAGSIDEVAIYPTALTAGQIAQHNTLGRAAAVNLAPTASFTPAVANLTASVDGSASADPDGSIASWAWNFGDGSTATGATASHTYTAAGSYTVTLTVTDNQGATGTTSQAITVTNPPATGATLASDSFERTITSGLGTADIGGPWSVTGSTVTSSVSGGAGQVNVPVGKTATVRLTSPAILDQDVTEQVWTDNAITGSGVFVTPVVRASSGGEYRVRAKLLATGQVTASLASYTGGVETGLTSTVTVPNVTYTAGMKLDVRVQAVGTSPTTLKYKIWPDGTTEPDWLQTVTDSTAALQAAGTLGVNVYASGSATASAVFRIDNVKAVTP